MSVLVGKSAPDFECAAVLADGTIEDNFRLSEATKGKYALLIFYPLDFTFVCPSELVALDNRIDQFKERNVEVIGISIDSQFTHHAWRETDTANGGIGALNYTLAADTKHEICQAYDVESEGGVAFRGAFLIDQAGIVQSQTVNNLPLGRNMDEFVRLVDALQFHEENGEVCPAGWQKGDTGMVADAAGVASYLKDNAKNL